MFQAIQEQQLKVLSTFLPPHDQTKQAVAGPSSSGRFTRGKKRLEPPKSPDPLVAFQQQAGMMQSHLRDDEGEEHEEPRNEDNFLDSVIEYSIQSKCIVC